MKTLYIECNMGAAGDMLTAALMELLPDPDAFVQRMNAIGVPDMHMERSEAVRCGVRGSHVSVKIGGVEEVSDDVPDYEPDHAHEHPHEHPHEPDHDHNCPHDHAHHCDHSHDHSHAGLRDVEAIVAALDLPEAVKRDVRGVYSLIAEAEAHAHGCDVTQIHFHEVGMMDAVTDVSAVCLLMQLIGAERVVVSPITTGYGEVRCMHGVVPVPAPATAYLLRGMPAQAGRIRGELLTPTGAALLKYFANDFGWMPRMRIEKIGCGMGMKEFEAANCVRVMLGETEEMRCDEVVELNCNLDDMTGEAISFASQRLMDAGALDVYSTAIQMKKGRPAVKLSCLVRPEDAQSMADEMLRHTTSLGVRMQGFCRRMLSRGSCTANTPYGAVELKTAEGAGIRRCKPEYESAARAALEHGVPLAEVIAAAMRTAEDEQ